MTTLEPEYKCRLCGSAVMRKQTIPKYKVGDMVVANFPDHEPRFYGKANPITHIYPKYDDIWGVYIGFKYAVQSGQYVSIFMENWIYLAGSEEDQI
jgi:hypothetical protein